MTLSAFDLFSVGIGPSSSHTVGPMRAASRFVDSLDADLERVQSLRVTLYGSLGATGIGHGTDRAVVLGLLGELPDEVDPRAVEPTLRGVRDSGILHLAGRHPIAFNAATDLLLDGRRELPLHPNGLLITAWDAAGAVIAEHTYYSIGGGFVINGDESDADAPPADVPHLPHPFTTAADLMAICALTGKSIATIVLENEAVRRTPTEVRDGLLHRWHVMEECVRNGLVTEGRLPGDLGVLRRAPLMRTRLVSQGATNYAIRGLDWLMLYAFAVNEENAAGGRVVTAPTNGAAGIIPAVLHYYRDFVPGADDDGVVRFLLTAAAIGMIVKQNASISGAEVGCQGEVGAACSMAAAGFAAVIGGTPDQVENAAEIGMEHNLGLTCDPVGGLVQIPCIERNAIAACKAVAAARAALQGDGRHIVSLDSVIKTMRETGEDMKSKYKETALGGLAVNVIEC